MLNKKREFDPDFNKGFGNLNDSLYPNKDQGQTKGKHCLPLHHNLYDDHRMPNWVT